MTEKSQTTWEKMALGRGKQQEKAKAKKNRKNMGTMKYVFKKWLSFNKG